VEPFAKKIGLDYISLGLKPLPFGYLRAIKKLNVKKSEAAIVGDQIFTDVLGGNLVGMKTILLTPIKLEDSYGFRFKRWLEKFVYKIHNIKDENE
jgi:HAD superfamily phosphatase (TIGR01668 family)